MIKSRLDAHLDWVDMVNQDIRAIQVSYKYDTDIIGRFIDTCCHLNDHTSKIPVTVLLNAFNEWSGDFWSSARFVKTMTSQGYGIKRLSIFGLLTDCFIHIELVGNIY